jgi:hypothetical protein
MSNGTSLSYGRNQQSKFTDNFHGLLNEASIFLVATGVEL